MFLGHLNRRQHASSALAIQRISNQVSIPQAPRARAGRASTCRSIPDTQDDGRGRLACRETRPCFASAGSAPQTLISDPLSPMTGRQLHPTASPHQPAPLQYRSPLLFPPGILLTRPPPPAPPLTPHPVDSRPRPPLPLLRPMHMGKPERQIACARARHALQPWRRL